MKIDIERLLCSLIECNTKSGHKYNWLADDIITSLRDQGLIYKDGQIISELEESEDERIRKYLIDMLKNDEKCYLKEIAWLEEQGQHKKFRDSIQVGDKVTRNEDGVLVNLSQLKRVAKRDEKQGEQKPAWSEEDDNCLSTIIAEFSKYAGKSVSKDEWMRCNNFLNSLRDRVQLQPQQEWSEEDERVLCKCLGALGNPNYCYEDRDLEHMRNWLKSLRPHNTWKPSEMQMKVLTAISSKEILSGYERGMLVGLYTELQKLREE